MDHIPKQRYCHDAPDCELNTDSYEELSESIFDTNTLLYTVTLALYIFINGFTH